MKAITFLGTGNYEKTIYNFNGKKAQPTELFPKALCELFELEELLVVVTKCAKKKWFAKLEEQLKESGIKITEVPIPDGHSEEDLWTIFDQITKFLDEGDELIFDITHSFRTVPLLSFLAANYLQTAKNVKIKGIYYGAFDAGQNANDSSTKTATVFDLTLFLELSRWVTATDKFITTGDAGDLAKLLKEIHDRERSKPQSDAQMPNFLQRLGNAIGELSNAMLVNRPHEIAEKAKRVGKLIQDERAILETKQFAKPLAVLLERIGKEFEPFANFSLVSQRKLIDWYLNHGQVVQAVALTREWLVSFVCQKLGLDQMKRDQRKQAEDVLNNLGRQKKQKPGNQNKQNDVSEATKSFGEQFKHCQQADEIVEIWNQAQDLRNDVLHFGFREQARPAKRILEHAKELNEKIQKLIL